jgi:hypothetical protein
MDRGPEWRAAPCAASKKGVVIYGEWSLFGGSINGFGQHDGIAKPGRRLFVR